MDRQAKENHPRWKRVEIGEFAQVKGGKRLPKGETVQDDITDHPYIRVVDFRDDGFHRGEVKYISDSSHQRVRRYTITSDDVYISIAGTIGRVGIVPPDFSGANLTENAAKITGIDGSVDKRFLMYYLRSYLGQSEVSARVVGTSQPKLALFRIKQIPVPQPPLPTQRKIAAILSAYDDLIDNNRRRIQILEETAQIIYREWFVHFRFPGHEGVGMVDSPLGPIPEGWRSSVLGDHLALDRGLSYKGKYLTNEGSPMMNLKNFLPDGGLRRDGTKRYSGPHKTKHTVEPGDLLIANTDLTQAGGIIGTPAIVPHLGGEANIIISHHLYAVRLSTETQVSKYFLYHLLLTNGYRSFARGQASGTTVLGLRRESILRFAFPTPPGELLNSFEQTVSPMHVVAEAYEQENDLLRAARDLLLPRLISGEVDVSHLDIDTGELDQ